ncbi:MAG: prepilin-type N-terminal cleavage/methylation domain-containing protein [Candidatus Absconditabacteria bacterium]
MAKSIRKLLKSFTLIELIIVIAIIAVLGATTFLLLTQWMSKGRDAQRISDLTTIKSALDIAITKNDELPLPDEAKELLYTGTKILYQGKFGDQVVKSIGTLNKVPKDRIHGEYEYSLLYDKKTYRVKAIIENEQYQLAYLDKVKASDEVYRYVGKDVQAVVVNGTFVYLPSMFISGYNEDGTYDLYDNDLDVFVGNKVGELKSGFVLSVEKTEDVKSKLLELGIDESKAVQIMSQAVGGNIAVQVDSSSNNCNTQSKIINTHTYNILPTINGEIAYMTSDSQDILNGSKYYSLDFQCENGQFNTIGEEIENILCNIGYVPYEGNCVMNKCSGTLPSNSIINGAQVVGESWNHNVVSGDCTFKCKDFYKYNNGTCSQVIGTHNFAASDQWILNDIQLSDGKFVLGLTGGFSELQSISTVGAYGGDVFEMNGKTYLTVSSYLNGTDYTHNSKIYEWSGTGFNLLQNIATVGPLDMNVFKLGNEYYLGHMMYYNGSVFSSSTNSKLYKWNGTSFELFQSLYTIGGREIIGMDMEGNSYIVILNYGSDANKIRDSKVYKLVDGLFVEYQSISTNGAYDVEYFNMGSDHYLGISNHFGGISRLYKWDGTNFIEFQTFSTQGGSNIHYFTMNGENYLTVSNYDGELIVYKWNGIVFEQVQSITTYGNRDVTTYDIGGEKYMFISNFNGGSGQNSAIYRYDGSNFVKIQSIPVVGINESEFFTVGGKDYLFLWVFRSSTDYTRDSKLYEPSIANYTYDYKTASNLETNRLDFSGISKIKNVVVTQSQPTGTNVKYLVSFDGGSTLKSKVSGTWEEVLPSEIGTKGMTNTQIDAALTNFIPTTETSLDIVVGLSSNFGNITSSFTSIKIDYYEK